MGLIKANHIVDIKKIPGLDRLEFNSQEQYAACRTAGNASEFWKSPSSSSSTSRCLPKWSATSPMCASETSVLWPAIFVSPSRTPIPEHCSRSMTQSSLCATPKVNGASRSKIFLQIITKPLCKKDELLTDIEIPKLADNFRGDYLRFCPGEWPMVTVALLTRWTGGTCAEARLGLGCVGPKPLRVTEFEEATRGRSAEELAGKGR